VPRTILITGASSGIGQALARRFAGAGCRLALLGRHERRLADAAGECRALGAEVSVAAIDVRDRAALATWIEEFDRLAPVDLVIANAGVMEGRRPGGDIEPADAAYRMVETNVLGVLNTVQPLLPKMMDRGRGQIAIVSSIAGFTPLPDAPSYSASKSAVINYGLSLRALLGPRGIRVSVICPGYVDTPMIRRESGAKPFKMSPEKAADAICRGLERDRALIVFPRLFGLMTRISGLLPDRMRRWAMAPFRFTVSDAE
jgi:short-subunit dehydrogenase